MLPASQELDCILAGLGLLQRYVRDVVDRMPAGHHRVDCWGTQVLEVQLGLPDMLAAAIDKSVLEDMVLNSLAGKDHNSGADGLVEVLLLNTLGPGR